MIENNYTPEPWIFCGYHVDDSLGLTLSWYPITFNDLNAYDCHLVAAAPDLSTACKDAKPIACKADVESYKARRAKLIAAIAKVLCSKN